MTTTMKKSVDVIPTEREVLAVIASVAEKHGFKVNSESISRNMIDIPKDFAIEVRTLGIYFSEGIAKLNLSYCLREWYPKTAEELEKLSKDSAKMAEFAKDLESYDSIIFQNEDHFCEKSSGWIYENGDENALQKYSIMLEKLMTESKKQLEQLKNQSPESEAQLKKFQEKLSELQNCGKNNKKILKQIEEVQGEIKKLNQSLEDIPGCIQKYQANIEVLREEIQKVRKILTPEKAELVDCIDDYLVDGYVAAEFEEISRLESEIFQTQKRIEAEKLKLAYLQEKLAALKNNKVAA